MSETGSSKAADVRRPRITVDITYEYAPMRYVIDAQSTALQWRTLAERLRDNIRTLFERSTVLRMVRSQHRLKMHCLIWNPGDMQENELLTATLHALEDLPYTQPRRYDGPEDCFVLHAHVEKADDLAVQIHSS